MGFQVFQKNDKFQARKGLEGPFHYPNGRVLYYDPKEGQYYDPTTDFYVEYEDVEELKNQFLQVLAK